jgi:putative intracellular protease/amidase
MHPQPKVVHSGNLLTGQNPASSKLLAEEILKELKKANVGNRNEKSEK